jgi:hypothetical protein
MKALISFCIILAVSFTTMAMQYEEDFARKLREVDAKEYVNSEAEKDSYLELKMVKSLVLNAEDKADYESYYNSKIDRVDHMGYASTLPYTSLCRGARISYASGAIRFKISHLKDYQSNLIKNLYELSKERGEENVIKTWGNCFANLEKAISLDGRNNKGEYHKHLYLHFLEFWDLQ